MVEKIYNEMLNNFSDTLQSTSKNDNEQGTDRYMTTCLENVVNVDRLKDDFVKEMALTNVPLSCDALYMTANNEFFLIEFKAGAIEVKKNSEIKVKMFESLLMFGEKFSQTIEFTRKNASFILVYNEGKKHGNDQYYDDGKNGKQQIHTAVSKLAKLRPIRFGLHRFQNLYFKNVFTYTKKEFETEFVSKYCG